MPVGFERPCGLCVNLAKISLWFARAVAQPSSDLGLCERILSSHIICSNWARSLYQPLEVNQSYFFLILLYHHIIYLYCIILYIHIIYHIITISWFIILFYLYYVPLNNFSYIVHIFIGITIVFIFIKGKRVCVYTYMSIRALCIQAYSQASLSIHINLYISVITCTFVSSFSIIYTNLYIFKAFI